MNQKEYFNSRIQTLRPINRYQILCECDDCIQKVIPEREFELIEGFDLTIDDAYTILFNSTEGHIHPMTKKYDIRYIDGKFIHANCLQDLPYSEIVIRQALLLLAQRRIQKEDESYIEDLKSTITAITRGQHTLYEGVELHKAELKPIKKSIKDSLYKFRRPTGDY
jgi:hypothetical protein